MKFASASAQVITIKTSTDTARNRPISFGDTLSVLNTDGQTNSMTAAPGSMIATGQSNPNLMGLYAMAKNDAIKSERTLQAFIRYFAL